MVTRLEELQQERKELQTAADEAMAEIESMGDYGQASQRTVDAAEYASYALKLWDDEFGEEMAQLKIINRPG